jgi:16S rRNA (uracil1498-N3)-methyltransferase
MLFYCPKLEATVLELDEKESRHLIQVLRKKEGDVVCLTDGRGIACEAVIEQVSKNGVRLQRRSDFMKEPLMPVKFHLYIAPTKNQDRMEWMLEKLTEVGLASVSFIRSINSEKNKLRYDRLEMKMLSAMKQSGRYRLPQLNELQDYEGVLTKVKSPNRFIAWCSGKKPYFSKIIDISFQEIHLLIGPEGDFTDEEVLKANEAGWQSVSLGPARLRTETAGLYGGMMAQHHFLSLTDEL